MPLTIIYANKEQANKIYHKHVKWMVFGLKCMPDSEDNIEFISCFSVRSGHMQFQMRRGKAMFFSIQIGNVEYDITNTEDYPELQKRLNYLGKKASKRFWRGAAI